MREEGRWVTIRFSFPQGNCLYCDQHLVGELESMWGSLINKGHLEESRQEMIIAWARMVAMMMVEMDRSRQM